MLSVGETSGSNFMGPLAILAVTWNVMNGVVIDWNFLNIIASLSVAVVSILFMAVRSYAILQKNKRDQSDFDHELAQRVEAAAKNVADGVMPSKDDSVLTSGKNWGGRRQSDRDRRG